MSPLEHDYLQPKDTFLKTRTSSEEIKESNEIMTFVVDANGSGVTTNLTHEKGELYCGAMETSEA